MSTETSSQGELVPYEWRAHGVNELILRNGVFHVRTHAKKGAPESSEVLRRLLGPDGPAPMPRREALDYEPLQARTLPNALARIAVTCDRESERNRLRRRELRRRYLAAGKARDEAGWLAEAVAGQEAERAAIKEITYFYHHYGDLGFQLLRKKGWPDSGEPLGWIIAEAKTVSFALALIDALNRHDRRDLKATLASRRQPDLPSHDGAAKRSLSDKLVRYAVCRDARHHGRLIDLTAKSWPDPDVAWYDATAVYRLRGDDEASLFDHAGEVAADLVRRHLPGQEYGFFWREARFIEAPARGPLLRALWLHVRNTAIDRAEVRSCQECGARFLVTDRRQRFCPPQAVGGKSRCLARRQMRLRRQGGPRPQRGEEEPS